MLRYRHLGGSGLEVSESGLGTNSFGIRRDAAESAAIVVAAADCGVTFIDTSRVYAEGLAEQYIGLALDGGLRREMVICTKFGSMREYGPNKFGGGRKHVIESVEGSLRRLRTDYIDRIHDAPARSSVAARRSAPHDGRSCPSGESPLHRGLQYSGVVACRDGVGVPGERSGTDGLDVFRIFARKPRRRRGDDSCVPKTRRWELFRTGRWLRGCSPVSTSEVERRWLAAGLR